MRSYALSLWDRAQRALAAARNDLPVDADAAASRAYYAAFFAVSAWFALQEISFTKHAKVEAAVHRDLVRSGLWPVELGEAYSRLRRNRELGDYGGAEHVTAAEAQASIGLAEKILHAVRNMNPEMFDACTAK